MSMLDALASTPVDRQHAYDVSVRHLLDVVRRDLMGPISPERFRIRGKEVPTIIEASCPTCGATLRSRI